jgi:hypothetical protein
MCVLSIYVYACVCVCVFVCVCVEDVQPSNYLRPRAVLGTLFSAICSIKYRTGQKS